LFDSENGVVRGFSFQKVPKCDWHGPRSHINRVGPVKTTDQVPAEIVQIGIDDGGNLRPLFVVAKNLAVPNYSDNLAGVRIDDIALEHVFLFSVLRVRCDVYNSEFGALFRFPCYVAHAARVARSRTTDVAIALLRVRGACKRERGCNRHGRYNVARLVEEHGDAKLTELLQTLDSCPKTGNWFISVSTFRCDECKNEMRLTYSDKVALFAKHAHLT
jgi:hypothetical protein